ncbi:hypothetical protein [Enterococcus malodoratus]|uniref:hypothetical protein n=4 Tax=Enterococcus TaxID=1350 RepID=UPI0022E46BFB|nr:hypothetical protein [Enterococcus malodoratus]
MNYKEFRKTTGKFPNDGNEAVAIFPLYQKGKIVDGIVIGTTKEWLDEILEDMADDSDIDIWDYLDQLEMSEENVSKITTWLEEEIDCTFGGRPYHILYEMF